MTDPDNGWFLRHRDGIEHGPFRYADIVAAAKRGNIAEDTCVFHNEKTLGQWVFAQRVQAIADVIQLTQPTPPQQRKAPMKAQARAARTAPRTPTRPAQATATSDSKLRAGEANAEPPEPKNPSVESLPAIRPYRAQGYPVPKTFLNACIAFVDVRFRSFVTPWIIKILWAFCLAGAILGAGKIAYDRILSGDVVAKPAGSEIAETGNWQFEPLGDQSLLQTSTSRVLLAIGGIFIAMLCIRVLCEAAIVLLRAATDLSDAKLLWREEIRQKGKKP